MRAFWLFFDGCRACLLRWKSFSATPKEAAAIVRAVSAVTNAVQFYKDNGKQKAPRGIQQSQRPI